MYFEFIFNRIKLPALFNRQRPFRVIFKEKIHWALKKLPKVDISKLLQE